MQQAVTLLRQELRQLERRIHKVKQAIALLDETSDDKPTTAVPPERKPGGASGVRRKRWPGLGMMAMAPNSRRTRQQLALMRKYLRSCGSKGTTYGQARTALTGQLEQSRVSELLRYLEAAGEVVAKDPAHANTLVRNKVVVVPHTPAQKARAHRYQVWFKIDEEEHKGYIGSDGDFHKGSTPGLVLFDGTVVGGPKGERVAVKLPTGEVVPTKDKPKPKSKGRKRGPGKKGSRRAGERARQGMLKFLHENPGWHSAGGLGAAVGLTVSGAYLHISKLIEEGKIEKRGEKAGTRYRLAAMPVAKRGTMLLDWMRAHPDVRDAETLTNEMQRVFGWDDADHSTTVAHLVNEHKLRTSRANANGRLEVFRIPATVRPGEGVVEHGSA